MGLLCVKNKFFLKEKVNRLGTIFTTDLHDFPSILCIITVLAVLFASIVIGGYMIYGIEIHPNLLMSLGDSWMTYVAVILISAQLIVGFLIIVNPVSKFFEEHVLDTSSTDERGKYLIIIMYGIIIQ